MVVRVMGRQSMRLGGDVEFSSTPKAREVGGWKGRYYDGGRVGVLC